MIKINNTNIYIGLERYEIRQSKICFNICRENGEREDYELNDDDYNRRPCRDNIT